MPSFDVVSKFDMQEIDNAVNMVKRDIANRFDFKGSSSDIELNKSTIFEQAGLDYNFKQDNLSFSNKGVLRGIHFQNPPFAQTKLVTVILGSIYDVAVDLRQESPTFGEYMGVNLDGTNYSSLYIPEGFGHAFCSLENNTIVMYKNTKEYSSKSESGIIWNDLDINIDWPIKSPILSDKDSILPKMGEIFLDKK